jgi:hypothetical protein
LQDLVEAALLAERSLVAIAGQPGIDEARVDRPQTGVVDPEPGRHRRTEILNEDISTREYGEHPTRCVLTRAAAINVV